MSQNGSIGDTEDAVARRCRLGAPVAAQAGDDLGALLGWVGATGALHPVPETISGTPPDEEKLQRGLCTLLCSLMSAAPADASLGHPELESLKPLLAMMKSQRADPVLCADACAALATLASRSAQLAKQVARLGAVKTLLLTMRAHIKKEDANEHACRVLRAVSFASDGCRKLIVEAHGVPMLCAVMKRHSLLPSLQSDGGSALAALILHSEAGLEAVAKEKEGVEVFVASMLICTREHVDFTSSKQALQKLADARPELVKRITMANGKKWLCSFQPSDGEAAETAAVADHEGEGTSEGQRLAGPGDGVA